MAIRIGINGFGRIGKLVFILAGVDPEIEIVHVNDRMPIDLIIYLLKYDTIRGKLDADIEGDCEHIILNEKKILVTHYDEPSLIPWYKSKADLVLESSGKFKTRSHIEGHLTNGAKKVILSCPASDDTIDRTVVMGVNHTQIESINKIISNSSCTTNCVAILLKVLYEQFGVQRAFMNTVHPYTKNQNLLDGYHDDFRRSRAAANNIIPTTSSAIRTIQIIMPEMKGKFDGFSTRVPVPDCSYVELIVQLGVDVSVQQVNNAFFEYSQNKLSSYLEYCADPIVSSDIKNSSYSAVFDSLSTKILGNDLIQILAWYDNEYGFSSRIIDLIKYIACL